MRPYRACALLALALALLLAAAPAARAGEPQDGRWVQLLSRQRGEMCRITYYGPHYGKSPHWCASGRRYKPDDWSCAVGPSMLAQVRAATGTKWYAMVRIDLPSGERAVLPVVDTGGINSEGTELDVDLPDETWAQLFPEADPYIGIVKARVWVWVQDGEGERS